MNKLTSEKIEDNTYYEVLDKENYNRIYKNPDVLKLKGDVKLKQVANILWRCMMKEIEQNGYSDLTFAVEGAIKDIWEIIELNNIE